MGDFRLRSGREPVGPRVVDGTPVGEGRTDTRRVDILLPDTYPLPTRETKGSSTYTRYQSAHDHSAPPTPNPWCRERLG